MNPFYLLNVLNNVNAKPVINDLVKRKIVIGASAGSIIMAQDTGYINHVEPELNDDVNLNDFKGLGITNIHIYPHKNNQNLCNEKIQEQLKEYEDKNNIEITFIEDGEGIFIDF